jgi:hypothetical protein
MPVIPTQQRTMDPYTDHRFSNTFNRFTRILTGGRDVILPYDVCGSVFDIQAYVPNSRNKNPHPYDIDRDFIISDAELQSAIVDYGKGFITIDELNRIQEIYDAGGYHFSTETADGFELDSDVSGDPYWEYDYDEDHKISEDEFTTIRQNYVTGSISLLNYLKANQFRINGGYHTDSDSVYKDSNNFVAGPKNGAPPTNIFDFNGNWRITYEDLERARVVYQEDGDIDLSKYLRITQFYNSGGYHDSTSGEDGYEPGPVPATKLYIGPGFLIKDDCLVHVKEYIQIDLTDTDNYIGNDSQYWGLTRVGTNDSTSINSDEKMYIVLAKYTYSRTSPAPQLTFVIANDRTAFLNNRNEYIYLGSFCVELLTGYGFNYLGVSKIFDYDTDEVNSNARLERPYYSMFVTSVDGGVLDSSGNTLPRYELST